MTSTIHIDMHREHRIWEAEISQWLDDIAEWQQQVAHLQPDLDKIKKKLDEHLEALRKHAGAVRMHEQVIGAHEHEIVGYERGGKGEELLALAEKHKLELSRQAAQRKLHSQLKRYHHEVMVYWRRLLSALGEPR